MDRLKASRFVKKAGGQVPKVVLKAMARQHPSVAIVWAHEVSRWALYQHVRGRRKLIKFLDRMGRFEAPTLANTVYALDKMHPRHFRSRAQQDAFLDKIDANPALEAAKKRSSDAIRVGSTDLFNVLNNRVLVAPGATGRRRRRR